MEFYVNKLLGTMIQFNTRHVNDQLMVAIFLYQKLLCMIREFNMIVVSLQITGMKRTIIVFVESVCRVETMSLSGKILYYFADHILVQWQELKDKYPLSRYIGRIV